jgi:hypothetical protein
MRSCFARTFPYSISWRSRTAPHASRTLLNHIARCTKHRLRKRHSGQEIPVSNRPTPRSCGRPTRFAYGAGAVPMQRRWLQRTTSRLSRTSGGPQDPTPRHRAMQSSRSHRLRRPAKQSNGHDSAPFAIVFGVTDGCGDVCLCDYETADETLFPDRDSHTATFSGVFTGCK